MKNQKEKDKHQLVVDYKPRPVGEPTNQQELLADHRLDVALIQSMEVGMIEALKILNPQVHQPNSLIIVHGANILGEPDMVDLMDKWKNKADEHQWGQEWTL